MAQSLRMASSRLLVTAAAKWSAAFSRMGWACCSSWFFSSSWASGGSERSIGALATESAMFS